MSFMTPRVRAGLAATTAIGLAVWLPTAFATADEDTAAECVQAGNVWVLVQQGDDVEGGCATAFANGLEALESAGFTIDAPGGLLKTISGQPSDPGPQDWWSYWHLEADKGAGASEDWKFYQIGGADSKPQPGSVEGWRLWDSWETEPEAPTVNPVADVVPGQQGPDQPAGTVGPVALPGSGV